MKIVLDANIIIAALLGSRGKIIILTSQNHDFYAPKTIIDEIKKYKYEICEKINYSVEEFNINYESLLTFIKIVEYNKYEEYINKAKEIIKRDTKDADYIACAIKIGADFIWSDDKDFIEQNLILVKNTDQFIDEGKFLS